MKSKQINQDESVPELQLVLVKKTKTNEDRLHELLHKLNLALQQLNQRKSA